MQNRYNTIFRAYGSWDGVFEAFGHYRAALGIAIGAEQHDPLEDEETGWHSIRFTSASLPHVSDDAWKQIAAAAGGDLACVVGCVRANRAEGLFTACFKGMALTTSGSWSSFRIGAVSLHDQMVERAVVAGMDMMSRARQLHGEVQWALEHIGEVRAREIEWAGRLESELCCDAGTAYDLRLAESLNRHRPDSDCALKVAASALGPTGFFQLA